MSSPHVYGPTTLNAPDLIWNVLIWFSNKLSEWEHFWQVLNYGQSWAPRFTSCWQKMQSCNVFLNRWIFIQQYNCLWLSKQRFHNVWLRHHSSRENKNYHTDFLYSFIQLFIKSIYRAVSWVLETPCWILKQHHGLCLRRAYGLVEKIIGNWAILQPRTW